MADNQPIMANSNGPGNKAINTSLNSPFNKGSRAATDSRDATKRSRPEDKYAGSKDQPIYKGTRDKHFDKQGVPKIKKSSQMGSGT